VTITSSVSVTNDTAWHTLVATWRPGRHTSPVFGIYRRGWSFSTSQDFNGDIACFASSWTPAMVRRRHADPFGFLRPSGEVPALIASAPPSTPPATGSGVVTFLMG
jgi:hypothetical protein